jgi:hypothetical protein
MEGHKNWYELAIKEFPNELDANGETLTMIELANTMP